TILNGKNGSQIAVTSSLGYEPRETVYLNNRIVVSAYGGFQVFDTDLNLLRTVSGLVDVQFLQPFQGNVTLVSDETNILSYNLSTGN
ncbi:MAG: hypothetical protein GWO20_20910, partial [Candidatus Korarchaeota archaeon]|nr:hypothetical protein [Candidatus Korarchaeota archaeon]